MICESESFLKIFVVLPNTAAPAQRSRTGVYIGFVHAGSDLGRYSESTISV